MNSGRYDTPTARNGLLRRIRIIEQKFNDTEEEIRFAVVDINDVDSALSENNDNIKKNEREKERVKEANRNIVKGYEGQRILNQGSFYQCNNNSLKQTKTTSQD